MKKPAAGNREAGICEEALRDLLLAASSPDNLDAFLRKILTTLCRQGALGPGAGLAVVLHAGKNAPPFTIAVNFSKTELRLLSDISGAGSKWAKTLLNLNLQGGPAKGCLLARFEVPGASPCAARLLELAAKTISGRLAQESRERQLTRERDIADAITHIEELYLAFPAVSLEEISRTVLDEARRLTGSRFGFAGYINPATGWLVVPTLTDGAWKNYRAKKGDVVFKEFTGLWGWVLKKKKPMLTNSAASDPRAKGLPPGHIAIEKFAAAPAVSGKKLVGILALANPPGDYPPTALDAVTKLARVYALMLCHKLAEQQRQADAVKHKAILDTSSDLIYTLNADGKLAYASRAVENYGYTQDEVIGRHFSDFSHPGDRERTKKAFLAAVSTGRTATMLAYRLLKKDGSFALVEQKSAILQRRGPGAVITGTIHDVTERTRLENILRVSEGKYRSLFETSRDALMILEPPNWKYTQANNATLDMFGAPKESGFLKLTPWTVSPKKQPDGRLSSEKAREMLRVALETGSNYFEWEHKRLYGPVFAAEVLLTRIKIGEKQVIQACIRDISARKRIEELLRQSELRQQLAMAQINGVLWVLDKNLRFLLSRGQGLTALGLKPDEVVGMTLEDFIQRAGPDSQSINAHHRALQGKNVSYEERINDTDFSILLSPLRDQDNKINGVVGIALNITEKKRMERMLNENEETLTKFFDTTTDAIFLKDASGRYLKANKACAELFLLKAEKMLGKSDAELFSPETAAESRKDDAEVMRQGRTLFFSKESVSPSGKSYLSVAKTPLRGAGGEITGLLGVIRDITGIKKMETQLAVAKAADALSKVARPMAHDFNNALSAISGYATLIDDDLPSSSPIKMEISRIIEAVRRAAELTSKLQDFARNPKIEDSEK